MSARSIPDFIGLEDFEGSLRPCFTIEMFFHPTETAIHCRDERNPSELLNQGAAIETKVDFIS